MNERHINWPVALFAIGIAVASATYCAGSWNDGSRLATVECLVDHGTWAIDESVFVKVPPSPAIQPYGPRANEFPNGTLDKLFINGHYYSDKSPVPALVMAGPYWLWRTFGGPSVADRPDLFCWWMTLLTSGLAYVVSVLSMNALAQRIGLPWQHRLLTIAALAFGTIALPYSRTVNGHEMLLGITAALILALHRSAFVVAGVLAGLAYSIDLGAGPVILIGTIFNVGISINRGGRDQLVTRTASVVVAMAIFPLLHHAFNYHVGGTFRPANANAEYFNWPGCPFDASTMSGAWNHSSMLSFVGYAIDLLVGKKGFWGHNLPLLIVLPLLPRSMKGRGLVWLCSFWCVGVWLIYAAGSRNYSGACVSVRWYVPLIAPIMYLAMLSLRERTSLLRPLIWLAMCGAIINTIAWWHGPWHGRVIFGYWAWCGMGVIGAMWLGRNKRITNQSIQPLANAA